MDKPRYCLNPSTGEITSTVRGWRLLGEFATYSAARKYGLRIFSKEVERLKKELKKARKIVFDLKMKESR